ncbi:MULTISPECIES: LytTR family DNA-binding domain-containing protein [unclassified Undibacterium]|uniref:LytR/AlgR family response regulator transcription factor n=1 Tax=unclassified Undibacterium TaxID=2630295 RepID=UPI002AC905F8|nr:MULTISPECIES: LytTR family DNA-binding domain-containing protein [unclassified Undibacterium]MEB0138035.1 LytTR family DNA-binding domain-containing protein [Undibacterium sp. CCC2.1]MEB0171227.1 LytTR family DNA-binding domain-containing protein [Undibacterium sp. CCC1.1]MEB0175272.1 LytTR family DNA-binding domain-containing protein [Undibacterium sp. CCC3.4]MEB0214680.1 LytTR family DNA-binding domain-containing protein [Undibacterium sp. 5I2]WPX42447.1 LytTR family DNA-binding domain-co
MPTAIIADDERLMREQLRTRLAQVWPELQIVAESKNGEEAITQVEQWQPDLIFLDIRMPVKTGLEAAQAIGNRAHIVFITAYDQYAIEAFDHGAVDYVLKPADLERLGKTVERLKMRLQERAQPADMSQLLSRLAQQIGLAAPLQHLQWIQASIGQELRLIAVEEILFFQSDEKYTRVQTANYEALIRKPVRELSEELDPALFWQIHRSTLVNAKAIAGVVRDLRGRHLVQIKGSTEKLEVSRSYVHLFKQM